MGNTGSILLFGAVLMAAMPTLAEWQKGFGDPTMVKGRVEDMAGVRARRSAQRSTDADDRGLVGGDNARRRFR